MLHREPFVAIGQFRDRVYQLHVKSLDTTYDLGRSSKTILCEERNCPYFTAAHEHLIVHRRFALFAEPSRSLFKYCYYAIWSTWDYSCVSFKVVLAYWKVKTPCHAHVECINKCQV